MMKQKQRKLGRTERKKIEEKIENMVPPCVFDRKNCEPDIENFLSFYESCNYKTLIFGKTKEKEFNSLYRSITKPELVSTYVKKYDQFYTSIGENMYIIDRNTCKIIEVRKRVKHNNKMKILINEFNKNFSLYKNAKRFLEKVEKLNCSILTDKDASFNDKLIPAGCASHGFCYNKTAILIQYKNATFPLIIDIFSVKADGLALNNKNCYDYFNKLLFVVKSQMAKNEYFVDSIAYQSLLGKEICDLLKRSKEKLTSEEIHERIKYCNRHYIDINGKEHPNIFEKYSNHDIGLILKELKKLTIIDNPPIKIEKKTSRMFYYTENEKLYSSLFNENIRSDDEIFDTIKNNKKISFKEAERILSLLSNGKLDNEHVLCAFSIFDLHEFVLLNEDIILESFKDINEIQRTYASFIIDYFRHESAEYKLLEKIINA